MKKNIDIIRYGANGEGVGIDNGKVIFVPYTLKDENVECEIIKDNKSYSVAKVVNINKKSPSRTKPVCPFYFECGGCNLQHINYDEQLKIKSNIVKNNLNKISNIKCDVNDTIKSDKQFFYRNHITFAVSKNGKLGFFKNNSHDVVEIDKCYLVDENINKCIEIFNSYFFDNNLKGFDFVKNNGDIKQVDIKFVDNSFLITIVATVLELPNINNLCFRLNCLNKKYSIYLSLNKQNNTMIFGEKLKYIAGEKQLSFCEENIKSYISSYSFIQVNNYIKSKIYDKIKQFVKGDIVVDAYSGRGVLSAIISTNAKKVYAIEIEESSCLDAKNILNTNNINNVECICGDCADVLPTINEKVDCIILDPPRKGVKDKVLKSVIDFSAQKLIYLSCASNTLARDLKVLVNNGYYKIVLVQPYDMFPNTSNIETLVLLEKNDD